MRAWLLACWCVSALVAGCSYESDWRPRDAPPEAESATPMDTTVVDTTVADMADTGGGDAMDASDATDEPETREAGEAGDLANESMDEAPGLEVGEVFDERDASLDADAGMDASDGACADACPAGESCFAGSCRLQRSCATSDPDAGCGLVAIAGGSFTMNRGGGVGVGGRELPGVVVGAFEMDSHEVTVARFRAFWNRGAPELPARQIRYPNDAIVPTIAWTPIAPTTTTMSPACNWTAEAGGRENHPINCVDWRMAQAFCVWDAGGEGGGRLPTAAEWEYAAVGRAVDGLRERLFPWGDDPPSPPCAEGGAGPEAQFGGCAGDDSAVTARVGRFGRISGLADIMGNVSEWVADARGDRDYHDLCWWSAANDNPFCVTADAPADARSRVARGGSFRDRSLSGTRVDPMRDEAADAVGFRCVRVRGAAEGRENNTSGAACPAGQARCVGVCIDPLGSPTHCGACGNTCPAGTVCSAGRCTEAQRSCADAGVPGCGMTSIEGGGVNLLPHVEARSGAVLAAGLPRISVSNFAIDVHEVTVGRFRAFVRAGSPTPPGMTVSYPGGRSLALQTISLPATQDSGTGDGLCNWTTEPAGREDHPINCITWSTAQAFCVWDGRDRGRLPTFAEWNHAARGTRRIGLSVGRTWPWGEQGGADANSGAAGVVSEVCARSRLGSDPRLVNPCSGRPGGAGAPGTGRVGQAVNDPLYRPYGGLFDLIGNVFEWVADAQFADAGARLDTCWENVDGGVMTDPLCRPASGPAPDLFHTRGGAFNIDGNLHVYAGHPQTRYAPRGNSNGDPGQGFRCARSAP